MVFSKFPHPAASEIRRQPDLSDLAPLSGFQPGDIPLSSQLGSAQRLWDVGWLSKILRISRAGGASVTCPTRRLLHNFITLAGSLSESTLAGLKFYGAKQPTRYCLRKT